MDGNKYKPQDKWQKEKGKTLTFKYKKELVDEFNQVCKENGLVKNKLVKQLILDTIKKYKKD